MNDWVEAPKWLLKYPQSPRREMCSRARMARNLELMAEQMLEMQRQQSAQTAVLNAYLLQGFMPLAPPVYPPYQPHGYEDQRESEEEENPYSYTSLVRPRARFGEMSKWIHSSTHIMGTTQMKIIETQTFLLNTHKNRRHPRDPVSSIDWREDFLETGGRDRQPRSLAKHHTCLRLLSTKLHKWIYHLVGDWCRSPVRGYDKPNGSALQQKSLCLNSGPTRMMMRRRQVHSRKG
ncbi:Uncharacterized protein Fot_10502 [Forsythia ovata]|uniref:Uncharacterized protein n=1 Tax=Forsythia ovata TaxID=205694 RepID=A0ABD1WHD8_9LAMI